MLFKQTKLKTRETIVQTLSVFLRTINYLKEATFCTTPASPDQAVVLAPVVAVVVVVVAAVVVVVLVVLVVELELEQELEIIVLVD